MAIKFLVLLLTATSYTPCNYQKSDTPDEIISLLRVIKSTGVLSQSPSTSFSRNNFDIAYEKSILRLGYFDETIAYQNPDWVKTETLNKIASVMAERGQSGVALEKLSRFQGRGFIAKEKDLEFSLKPGLDSGELLFAVRTGDLARVKLLFEKVITHKIGESPSDSVDRTCRKSLYKTLIKWALKHDQIQLATELFFQAETLTEKGLLQIGISVTYAMRITKSFESARMWLKAISAKHPRIACELAGYYAGRFEHQTQQPASEESRKQCEILFSLIRSIESDRGEIIEIKARAAQLNNHWTPENQKQRLTDELVEAFHQGKDFSNRIEIVKHLPTPKKIRLLEQLAELADETPDYRLAKTLIDAYMETNQPQKAQSEFAKLQELSTAEIWFDFAILAAKCQRFETVQEIINAKYATELNLTDLAKVMNLELLAAAYESNFSDPQPVIDLMISWPKPTKDKRLAYARVLRFMESKAFLAKFVKKDYRLAEAIILEIPDGFFHITTVPSRDKFRRTIVNRLLFEDRVEATKVYLRYCRKNSVKQIDTLEEIYASHLSRQGLHKESKSLLQNAIRSQTPNNLSWQFAQQQWITECLPDLKNADQSKVSRYLVAHSHQLAKICDLTTVLDMGELVRSPRDRCKYHTQVLMSIAEKEYGVTDGFEFPMRRFSKVDHKRKRGEIPR